MSVSLWSPLLTELRASYSKYTPGDYGRPGTYEEIIPAFTCYGQKLDSREKQVAGVDAAVQAWRLYADLPLHPKLTESAQLALSNGETGLGTFNVRWISDPLPDGTAELEVDRLSTQ